MGAIVKAGGPRIWACLTILAATLAVGLVLPTGAGAALGKRLPEPQVICVSPPRAKAVARYAVRPRACNLHRRGRPTTIAQMVRVRRVRWRRWGTRSAVGMGWSRRGRRRAVPTRVRLSRPRRVCGRTVFARARLRFGRSRSRRILALDRQPPGVLCHAAVRATPPPRGPLSVCEAPCSERPPLPPDVDPPRLHLVRFSPRVVDSAATDPTVTLEYSATDATWIKSIEIEIDGPDGVWREIADAGDESSFYVHVGLDVFVPPTTQEGRYSVGHMRLEDALGNAVTYGATELEELSEAVSFDVYHGPDTEGPELLGISLTPESVDTSSAPRTVDFAVAAGDDLSGVAVVLPEFKPPAPAVQGYHPSGALQAGDLYEGTWGGEYPLPTHAAPGAYAVRGVDLRDRAGNRRHYDLAELEGLGLAAEFIQEGAGDTTPPQIVDAWVAPKTISASHGEGAFDVYVAFKDDLAGFDLLVDRYFASLGATFEPPEGAPLMLSGFDRERVSGDDLEGLWRIGRTMSADAAGGEYRIDGIQIIDRAGNRTSLSGSALEAKGWDLSFVNLP